MPKLSETKPGKNLSVLLVGYPGSGKSIAAASFPGPIYIFELDQRIDSILPFYGSRDDIEWDYYGPNDYAKLDAQIKAARSGALKFKTYILDSLTALARMGINYSINIRGGGKGSISKGVIQMTTVDDYNAESRVLSVACDYLRELKRAGANVILTAHLVETSSKKAGPGSEDVVVQRLLTGGKTIAAEIPSYFNEIYYVAQENNNVSIPPTMNYVAYTVTPAEVGTDTKTALSLPAKIDFTMNSPSSDGLYQKMQKLCKEKGIEIG